jgi:L-fuconolactonase
MMRLDAHQHFWKYHLAHQSGMTDQMQALRRDSLPGELQPLLQPVQFDGTTAVQARQMVEETAWLLELADAHEFITRAAYKNGRRQKANDICQTIQ